MKDYRLYLLKLLNKRGRIVQKENFEVGFMIGLDKVILLTFIYEENTILHVANHLKSKGINKSKNEIKSRLSLLLNKGFIKLYDDPSNGTIDFLDTNDVFEEDYWFVLTDKGKSTLNV
ncbi:hypothetical protein FZW96_20960 [Bacillus sp. BGMRC 2118]|nr:hypothetical protein FZW96_20960 [Bacillus sp. BGMRC 2118]